jgi:hypothetical protein
VLLRRADMRLSFDRMTLPQQLMRLVLVEADLSRVADQSGGTVSQVRRNFRPVVASFTLLIARCFRAARRFSR